MKNYGYEEAAWVAHEMTHIIAQEMSDSEVWDSHMEEPGGSSVALGFYELQEAMNPYDFNRLFGAQYANYRANFIARFHEEKAKYLAENPDND